MAINKVVINSENSLDLSNDTVSASDVASGVTFHDKTGAALTGTASNGSDNWATFWIGQRGGSPVECFITEGTDELGEIYYYVQLPENNSPITFLTVSEGVIPPGGVGILS